MNIHDATEVAYKNGYEDAVADMNRQNQIEEMTSIIDRAKDSLWDEARLDYRNHSRGIAQALYDAGYRRVSTGLKYQERLTTYGDLKSLYRRVKADPHIKQYRGYSNTKSYGYDEEGHIISKKGEFWFDNPSFKGE